jgi:hypothetical protein
LETISTSSPFRSFRRIARSVSADQLIWDSSLALRSDSSSRTNARMSRATGRNSGIRTFASLKPKVSPRITAFRPATQPRQLTSAITTVTRETMAASAANR